MLVLYLNIPAQYTQNQLSCDALSLAQGIPHHTRSRYDKKYHTSKKKGGAFWYKARVIFLVNNPVLYKNIFLGMICYDTCILKNRRPLFVSHRHHPNKHGFFAAYYECLPESPTQDPNPPENPPPFAHHRGIGS